MALQDYIDQEAAEGVRVAEDLAFTLDPKQVRERVGTFCKENRIYPLLRCLQAIIRVSESDLFIAYESKTWVVRFRWSKGPSQKALSALLADGASAEFDDYPSVVSQHLFFGLSAALGEEQYDIRWRTPEGTLRFAQDSIKGEPETSDEYSELHFKFQQTWWRNLTTSNPKTVVIEELTKRLCYSPVPIHIQGSKLRAQILQAPERPWLTKLKTGSTLAWRFVAAPPDEASVQPPTATLDNYRSSKNGSLFHQVKENQGLLEPLSVQYEDAKTTESASPFYPAQSSDSSDSPLCQTALFLSIEAGRNDWIFPVRDGLLLEPVKASFSKGGVVALISCQGLNFDLSGLKLVENEAFEERLLALKKESSKMRSNLRTSLANIAFRAKTLPQQYDQAVSYIAGGPYAALIGAKVGPWVRNVFGNIKATETRSDDAS